MSDEVTKVVGVDDEIWTPAEREEKGDFLSRADQMGEVQMDLTVPLERSDGEPVDHLLVRAPRTRQIQMFQSNRGNDIQREIEFFGGCCAGINPKDLENLHGRDWSRLGRLVSNFIV